MTQSARPLSPHIGIYRWEIQMMTSIVHRITGIALAIGTVVVLWGLFALASGPDSYAKFQACAGSWPGRLLLIGWTWALAFHLLNGIRHLLQDVGLGYGISQFVRNGWLAVIGSLLLTVLIWIDVLMFNGGV